MYNKYANVWACVFVYTCVCVCIVWTCVCCSSCPGDKWSICMWTHKTSRSVKKTSLKVSSEIESLDKLFVPLQAWFIIISSIDPRRCTCIHCSGTPIHTCMYMNHVWGQVTEHELHSLELKWISPPSSFSVCTIGGPGDKVHVSYHIAGKFHIWCKFLYISYQCPIGKNENLNIPCLWC